MSAPVINTFIVKVASRCNLACDYCYMYEHADQSWRAQPTFMETETAAALAFRLGRYVRDVDPGPITLLIHGGEPLLAGPERLRTLCDAVRKEVAEATQVTFSLQTNATLLTPEWVALLAELEVGISLSLDGDLAANDRHRRDHANHSSYEAVRTGIKHIRAHPEGDQLLSGILAVIDLANDSVATFDHLAALGPPSIDFLMPDGTFIGLPPGVTTPGQREGDAPYGRWLSRLFDHWYESETGVGLRLFENIMDLCLGGESRTEGVGIGSFAILTIETSGEIQDVDVLKVSFPGAPRLGAGYNVATDDFATVLQTPTVLERARLVGLQGLSTTCQTCELVQVCGGGHLPHRFHPETGFDNPSIYCPDLAYLIRHIKTKLKADLAMAKEIQLW